MLYQKKPYVIKAVPFELGMEDGLFDMWLQYDMANIYKYGDSPYIINKKMSGTNRLVAYVPYVTTAEGERQYVQINSFVATNEKGNKFLISKEALEAGYDVLES